MSNPEKDRRQDTTGMRKHSPPYSGERLTVPDDYRRALDRKGRPLFIPFLVLGDPDRKRSIEAVGTLLECGADALELGLPFSDPPADGPVIQAADRRALSAGIRTDDCFEILGSVRRMTELPVGLLVYYNLVLQRGLSRFYADCARVGVNSVLIADLPLEHAGEAAGYARRNGVAQVMMISELTGDDRLTDIAGIAEGYLYVVGYPGVTGRTEPTMNKRVEQTIRRGRRCSTLPLFIGFGISGPEQARAAVNAGADGVIVGSRLVREVGDLERLRKVCREITAAVRRGTQSDFAEPKSVMSRAESRQ